MAATYNFVKSYRNFKGLDLRSSQLEQDPGTSPELINADFRPDGSLTKRKGYQYATGSGKGGYGAVTYENVASDGTSTEEFLTVDQDLYVLSEDSFTVTYSPGDGSSGKYEIYYDNANSAYFFDIYDSSTTRVLNYNMGNGYSGTNKTVTQTIAAIDALTSIAASGASTAGAENAAFIPATNGFVTLSDGTAVTITFKYYTQVTTPSGITNPLSTFYAKRTSTDFENATFAQLNQVMYVSTGYDPLHKYDGLRFYAAGLPVGTTPTAGTGSGGSLTAGAYLWKYTYFYKDAKGNEIESTPTATVSFTSAGSDSRSITVSNLQNTSGYNTDQCVVNGTQAGVNTITVDSSANIQVGDYLYIDDGVSGEVVSRKVTAVPSGTTITVDGSAVNVSDNDVLSNIKIALYRTQSGGSIYYLSKELINDTDNATQAYDDGTADASLGAEFVEPIKPHGVPVQGKYIRAWRSQLVIAGSTSATNAVYYSDIENPEYFPPADNSFNVSTTVTGIRELDNIFFVFKERSIDAVSGDFGTDQFEVDNITKANVGCVAHATIEEVNKTIWFLANDGVYAISSEGLAKRSEQIEPRFSVSNGFSLKQAIAFNWIDKEKYILMLPILPVDPTYANDTTSKIYAFDSYPRHNAWIEWKNFNFLGGIDKLDDDIFMIRRAKPSGTVYTHTQKIARTGSKNDYVDHDAAISFTFQTHWETLGEPALFKKFLRLKVYGIDTPLLDFETPTYSLSIAVAANFLDQTIGSTTMDFFDGALGWGASEWGGVPWGEIRLPDLKTKLVSKKLKSQRLEFTNNTIQENVLISGYELSVAAPFQPNFKE